MKSIPIKFTFFILALAGSGACVGDDHAQEIWRQPASGGKADSASSMPLLSGSDIPSAHVDAQARYLPRRNLQTLTMVGALEGTRLSLALRVDGILDNSPTNGRLEVEELVRMEAPEKFDLLFPDEKAELANLWSYFLYPEDPIELTSPAPAFGFEHRLEPPTDLSFPTLAIADLKLDHQAVATRIQNAANADNDMMTVDFEDIDFASSIPGSFTEEENIAVEELYLDFKRMAVSNAVNDVTVPVGSYQASATHSSGITAAAEVEVRATQIRTTFKVSRASVATLSGFGDARLVYVRLDNGDDLEGDELLSPSGAVVIEAWDGADSLARFVIESEGLSLAGQELPTSINLFTSDGTPLHPQCIDELEVISEFVATIAAAPCADFDILNRDVIPPGRYRTVGEHDEWESYTVDVYPGGAVYVHRNGHGDDDAVTPGSLGDSAKYSTWGRDEYSFAPRIPRLHLFKDYVRLEIKSWKTVYQRGSIADRQ